jgi:hypothetical protein
MKRAMLMLAFVAAAVSPGAGAGAQTVSVGYPPQKSPFRDLEYHSEFTLFGGYFRGANDPAGVAPKGGPIAGIRYEIGVGGPAQLVVRAARASSTRNVIDPTQPAATRSLGSQAWPVYLADLGLSLNLTGQRSYHGIVPVIYSGVGIATDAGKKVTEDPYRLGTTFALSFAGGLRFVPGGRFQVRADAGTYMYQIKYPAGYFINSSDNTAFLGPTQAKSFWKRNGVYTLGLSYLLFR